MKPLYFKESTIKLLPPASIPKGKCGNLCILQTEDGQCVSLWTTSIWGRVKFLFHGKLWLGVVSGRTQPPVWLDMSNNIFIKPRKND